MSDYFYLPNSDPNNDGGLIPISSEEMVAAIRKIAKREGVTITDQQIVDEVFSKKPKKTSRKSTKQISVYIDGTNLLAGLVDLYGLKAVPSFKSILNDIDGVFNSNRVYFYASYTSNTNPKYQKFIATEGKFYKQVRKTTRVVFYKGHRSPTSGKEKGVDVHLAIDIVKGAFRDDYDEAVIMTGDSDLIYAIETAQTARKPVHAIFIPTRFSLEIAFKATTATVLNYKRKFHVSRKLPLKINIVKK